MSKLSDYDLEQDCSYITLEQFRIDVAWGGLIDDDGFGYASYGDVVIDEPIYPSEADDIDTNKVTHILWFNK